MIYADVYDDGTLNSDLHTDFAAMLQTEGLPKITTSLTDCLVSWVLIRACVHLFINWAHKFPLS
jgi:hypothetical protein